ncbi:MAG: hypothetical protein WD595_01050 [Waddliaceae bacterium]
MSWLSSASSFVGSYLPSGQSIVNQTGNFVSWCGRSVVLSHQTRLADRLRPYTKLALHNAAGYLIGGLPGCIVGSAIEVFFLDTATYGVVYKLADGAGLISLKAFEALTGAVIAGAGGSAEQPGMELKKLMTTDDGYVLISREDLSLILGSHKKKPPQIEGVPDLPKVDPKEIELALENLKKDFFCKKK